MNSFSDFNSFNGWGCGGQYYIDDCGDLWMPCRCCEAEGEGGGAEAGIEAAGEEFREELRGAGRLVRVRDIGQLREEPESMFVAIHAPRVDAALADADRGNRWLYKGIHTGFVHLYIAEPVANPASPEREPGDGMHYGICFFNSGTCEASVAVRRQGASARPRHRGAMLRHYFESVPEPPVSIAPETLHWLFLGRANSDEALRFQRRRRHQARILHPGGMEALLDLEIRGHLTIFACAYRDFNKIDGTAAAL